MALKQTPSVSTETGEVVSSTGVVTPIVFAYKPPPDDLVLEIFEQVGVRSCLKCYVKVQSESMLLCQCGHFICKNCFLSGCFCSKEEDEDVLQEEGKNDCSYYILEGSVSQEIILEGKTFQLECVFGYSRQT